MTKYHLSQRYDSPHGEARFGTAGTGPAVVLCHGTPTSSLIWHNVIPALEADFTCYFLDLPGYGQSAKFEAQDLRLRALAQTISGFCQHLGMKQPHLVGHDFGAAAVLGAHLVEGLEARSLTIADGVVLSPWGTPYSRLVKGHEAVFAAVPAYIHRAVLAAHLRTAMFHSPASELLEGLIEPWTGELGQKAYYRNIGQFDYDYTTQLEKLYPGISIPTTVIWGEEDRWVDISEGKKFAALIPQARFDGLPGAGHFSMLDTPALFVEKLRIALMTAEGRS
jgi:pimeloyl-ACP methyl ester carboxylesterase